MAATAAATPFDGIYTGIFSCEETGTSPGFTQRIGLVVRDDRFATERGHFGANGWERLDGTVAADGTATIIGRYIAGGIEKPIRYDGRITGNRLEAAGRRGPRRCILTASAPPASGATPPYRSAPDGTMRRALLGTAAKIPFVCPEPPAPIRDVLVEPFYRKDDPTHSIVDPEAYQARRRAAAPLDKLSAGIARIGDAYIRTKPREAAIAACLFGWMETWAQAGAMLGRVTHQGAYERKWTLATLSLNYGLLADAPEIAAERRRPVEAWLDALAWATVPPYAAKPFAAQNNHLNWAALAALATATAVQDRSLFDWAIAALKGVVDRNIAADGSLPHELKRARRAMHYHRFALEPLAVAAEIAMANGIDLYAENDGALHRLVAFTAAAIEDPTILARRVGVAQDRTATDAAKPIAWSWAVPYLARFPDHPALAATVGRLRGRGAFFDKWLGGDLALRFGG